MRANEKMKILDYKLYYFLGIGGIGMSALARYFNHFGKTVQGYDKTSTTLTSQLQKENIACHFSEEVDNLKKLLSSYEKGEVLIVYTPAVPKNHTEYNFLLENVPGKIYVNAKNIFNYNYIEFIGNVAPIRNYSFSFEIFF